MFGLAEPRLQRGCGRRPIVVIRTAAQLRIVLRLPVIRAKARLAHIGIGVRVRLRVRLELSRVGTGARRLARIPAISLVIRHSQRRLRIRILGHRAWFVRMAIGIDRRLRLSVAGRKGCVGIVIAGLSGRILAGIVLLRSRPVLAFGVTTLGGMAALPPVLLLLVGLRRPRQSWLLVLLSISRIIRIRLAPVRMGSLRRISRPLSAR